MSQVRDGQDASYISIVNGLLKYEDSNVEYYSESDPLKRIMTHPNASDFKERMELTYKGWSNPYKEAYYWIKGELLDIKGINDALLGRE